MAVYVRYAHKARKIVAKLDAAKEQELLASEIVAVTILDKGAGTFTLTFHFYDGTEFTLDNTELATGDLFEWDIESLFLTNTAQAGKTLKLLVDIQVKS